MDSDSTLYPPKEGAFADYLLVGEEGRPRSSVHDIMSGSSVTPRHPHPETALQLPVACRSPTLDCKLLEKVSEQSHMSSIWPMEGASKYMCGMNEGDSNVPSAFRRAC